MTDDLQTCIDSISQSINLAQNVVKALSIADKVISKASSILSG